MFDALRTRGMISTFAGSATRVMRARLWHNRLGVALGVNAGLMLAVLLSIAARPSVPTRGLPLENAALGQTSFAQSLSPAGGAGAAQANGNPPLIVMPGQLAPNIYGCYLLDPSQNSLCVYEYFHSDGLKLVAARNIAYDRRLQNFNTSPAPSEVKSLAQSSPADTDH